MEFWPPVEGGRPLVSEARALMDGPVKATIAAHEEASGDSPDGGTSPEVGELKRKMHRLGPRRGSTRRTCRSASEGAGLP